MAATKIEWTDESWNPITGCTKISDGCHNCYAERMALRLRAMKNPKYRNGFELTVHRDTLNQPAAWRKPRTVFVNSMSDMFHEALNPADIHEIFQIMKENELHTFQVLTKRAENLRHLSTQLTWTDNIWMGVTVESAAYLPRIESLRECGARVKFLSFEPLLDAVGKVSLNGIDWVIAGGESGPKARLTQEAWIVEIRDQCIAQEVPFFFKQWGGTNKKKSGRELAGRIWNEMPFASRPLAGQSLR